MSVKDKYIDPVTLSVIAGSLNSAAKEMGLTLFRMAYSSIIRESEDLGAGLFDADGNELCESDSTPMHIGSLPGYITGVRHFLGDDIHDGDVILHNNPYHGASHTPDLAIIIPIFYKEQLVGFAANTGHVLDTGGSTPGIVVDVVDVYAEGKIYNAVKLFDKGVKNTSMWRHIFENVRTKRENEGDVEAMIASAQVGKRRFLELIERYGLETVQIACNKWMDYSEKMLRAEIEKIPDGIYTAPTAWLDDDGRNYGKPLRIEVSVEIQGSDITVDLTGSSPQVETAYNVPFSGSTLPGIYTIIRSLLLDEANSELYVPQNSGIFRPIKVIAPEGSIFNPRYPAACMARFNQIQRVADQINLCLGEVLPKKTNGGNSANIQVNAFSGINEEDSNYWIYIEVNEGSYGGRYGKDGMDSVDNLIANTRNNPIEELEMRLPMLCERYELRDEGAAAGQWRGGIGIVRNWKMLSDGVYTGEGDRQYDVPRGVHGGQDGLTGKLALVRNGEVTHLPGKQPDYRLKKDDILITTTPCGGGYGNPLERHPELVISDLLDEFIQEESVKNVYGVIYENGRIDIKKTKALRQQLI